MAALGASTDTRRRVKKSLELDVSVDEGLKEIARFQFVPQIGLINQILRDYVELTLPDIRRRRAESGGGPNENGG